MHAKTEVLMTETAIRIDGLNQRYEDNVILRDINLAIESGEYIGLVGINGAGKTTLIKAILDFISIDSGSIEIFGCNHRDTKSREALVFLPEKFLPPHYLTGRDFLSYMAELNDVQLNEADIAEIFNVVDLDLSALGKSVRKYSKGMAQKLGLASCFISKRPLYILDEPMSGLDPKARSYLKQHLLSLKASGKTLFFSTHLLNDVESLCDRIIVLHDGEIKFSGTPQDCCEKFSVATIEEAYLACIGG